MDPVPARPAARGFEDRYDGFGTMPDQAVNRERRATQSRGDGAYFSLNVVRMEKSNPFAIKNDPNQRIGALYVDTLKGHRRKQVQMIKSLLIERCRLAHQNQLNSTEVFGEIVMANGNVEAVAL